MSVTSLFLPEVVEEVVSPINGKIQVVQAGNRRRFMAGGLIQSGGVLRDIWKKGLKRVKERPGLTGKSRSFRVNRVLILGLGGGTAARLAAKMWPKAEIVGVEIDPVMIKLGNKYFGLTKLEQLTTVQADAFEWVKHQPNKFDLILVDMYLGELVPEQSEEHQFLQDLKSILATSGKIIFNRLFYDQHQQTAQAFVEKVEKEFGNMALVRAWSNLLVLAG